MKRDRTPGVERGDRFRGRGIASLIFAALLALLVGTTAAARTATPTAAETLTIDGDPIATVVAGGAGTTLYAIGHQALYRSADAGAAWARVGDVPPPGRLVVALDDPDLLLVGDYPPCGRGGDGQPLGRSNDGGATWSVDPATSGIRPVAVWATGPAIGVSCRGLLLSPDGGRSWTDVPSPTPGISANVAVLVGGLATPRLLVAGTSEGGSGQLWTVDLAAPIQPSVSGVLLEFWGAASLAADEQRYVVGTARGVLVSDDAGATWATSRRGLEEVTVSVDPNAETIPDAEIERGFGVSAVALGPSSADRLYAGTTGGLFVSHDAGRSWAAVAGVEGTIEAVIVTSARIFAETENGVVVTPHPA